MVVDSLEDLHVPRDGHGGPGGRQYGRDLVANLEVPDLGVDGEDAVDLLFDVRVEQILVADEAQQVDAKCADPLDDRCAGFEPPFADFDSNAFESARSQQLDQRVLVGAQRLTRDVNPHVG